jgi:hypothetical protein
VKDRRTPAVESDRQWAAQGWFSTAYLSQRFMDASFTSLNALLAKAELAGDEQTEA